MVGWMNSGVYAGCRLHVIWRLPPTEGYVASRDDELDSRVDREGLMMEANTSLRAKGGRSCVCTRTGKRSRRSRRRSRGYYSSCIGDRGDCALQTCCRSCLGSQKVLWHTSQLWVGIICSGWSFCQCSCSFPLDPKMRSHPRTAQLFPCRCTAALCRFNSCGVPKLAGQRLQTF